MHNVNNSITDMVVAAQENCAEIRLAREWNRSAVGTETTLHQLSPYIGKLKSTIAAAIIAQFTKRGDTIYDPFSGCGTVAFEAWMAERNVVATDLNPYAYLLTRAKLYPETCTVTALKVIERVAELAETRKSAVDLRFVPLWIRRFFHSDTLREILAWNEILTERRLAFLQACLLGILHHQRPGFLSFPSCHTVPYLRVKTFPRSLFPQLYMYRPLRSRLEAKVKRALRRVPNLQFDLKRRCFLADAGSINLRSPVDAIITSPPYMRRLDYGRDNRLRLWFLGTSDWNNLDRKISVSELEFLELIRRCLRRWRTLLRPNSTCVLILGDSYSHIYRAPLPDVISDIAVNEVGGYQLKSTHTDEIPDVRRVRRGAAGTRLETILVLKNGGHDA